jgi:F0F1-type ATP synthase assembly protein I
VTTNPYPGETRAGASRTDSLGDLVSQITTDLSTLMRQELALAKAEVKQEASQAAKGAGMLGAAGYAGYLVSIFFSLAVMFLLDKAMPTWVAALIVAVVYGAIAAVLFVQGKKALKHVDPTPHQTIETLKELP